MRISMHRFVAGWCVQSVRSTLAKPNYILLRERYISNATPYHRISKKGNGGLELTQVLHLNRNGRTVLRDNNWDYLSLPDLLLHYIGG